MDFDHELNDAEKAFIKGLGTAEEIMQKISEAESKGDYLQAYCLAYDANQYGVVELSEKLDILMKKVDVLQKQLLDSHPMGKTVINQNGLFMSVCCQELKDAILAKKVEVTADCMTNIPYLVVIGPELLSKAFGRSEGCYEEDDFGETSECPFCKKEIFDHFIL